MEKVSIWGTSIPFVLIDGIVKNKEKIKSTKNLFFLFVIVKELLRNHIFTYITMDKDVITHHKMKE